MQVGSGPEVSIARGKDSEEQPDTVSQNKEKSREEKYVHLKVKPYTSVLMRR